jgi:hypothetical protein
MGVATSPAARATRSRFGAARTEFSESGEPQVRQHSLAACGFCRWLRGCKGAAADRGKLFGSDLPWKMRTLLY